MKLKKFNSRINIIPEVDKEGVVTGFLNKKILITFLI